jgi:hypothetical protein
MTNRITGLLAAMGAAALLAACNTTLLLNDDNLEIEIASWISDQGGGIATVTCPDDRPLRQGDTFQCEAALEDGSTVTLQVTQTDDTGNVSWTVLD